MIHIDATAILGKANGTTDLLSAPHVNGYESDRPRNTNDLPARQAALVLHGLKQPYQLTYSHPTPVARRKDELIIRVHHIGLNPVDWRNFGFGIPELPYVAGRDISGVVVQLPSSQTDLRLGDVVLHPSTDYRDMRKAGFQEYTVALQQNVCRIPRRMMMHQGASIGVAYVAAALLLGVCIGLPLPGLHSEVNDVDLLSIVRSLPPESIPQDIRKECFTGIADTDRPRSGDWIAIWGGSSTTALFASQIAVMAGLRVILIADTAKHAERVRESKGIVWVDGHHPERAVDVIKGITGNKLRFAADTVGSKTAAHLQEALVDGGHLVGLAGLPKHVSEQIKIHHSVPIKLFHEVPEIGFALMGWLEAALRDERLTLPDVTILGEGFDAVNQGLDQMRAGAVSGKRLVVSVY